MVNRQQQTRRRRKFTFLCFVWFFVSAKKENTPSHTRTWAWQELIAKLEMLERGENPKILRQCVNVLKQRGVKSMLKSALEVKIKQAQSSDKFRLIPKSHKPHQIEKSQCLSCCFKSLYSWPPRVSGPGSNVDIRHGMKTIKPELNVYLVHTLCQFVSNKCILWLFFSFRLSDHHGGEWGDEVVFQRQLQCFCCGIFLLLRRTLVSVRKCHPLALGQRLLDNRQQIEVCYND